MSQKYMYFSVLKVHRLVCRRRCFCQEDSSATAFVETIQTQAGDQANLSAPIMAQSCSARDEETEHGLTRLTTLCRVGLAVWRGGGMQCPLEVIIYMPAHLC
jgi:hypothetical protein